MIWLLVGAGLGLIVLAHTAPFPFLLEKLSPGASLWRVRSAGGARKVYLTFDDGPNPEATPALLDVLAAEGATATFFLIDRHLTEDTAPIVRRMFDEGHAVALHSHTRELMLLPPDELAARLRASAGRIEQLTGRRPCPAFRPHAGWRSGRMYGGLERIDHLLVGWTWGLWDWNWYRPRVADALAQRLLSRIAPGDIVVMHDGHHENPRADRRYAVEATAKLVPELRARGFSFGTIGDDECRDGAQRASARHAV